MEILQLSEERKILCSKAGVFPDGIKAAFETLEKALPDACDRDYYGISKPENGVIVYKAGVAQQQDGEGEKYGFELFTLDKGSYLSIEVMDWAKNVAKIGEAFKTLIADPRMDPKSYCIEWYQGQNVTCMVKLLEV